MHIAVTPDEAYIPHCATMLHSLMAHHPGVPLDVHLLVGPINNPYWSELGQYLERFGSRLHVHVVSDASWWQLPEPGYPRNAWLKILLPDWIEVPRVLYLDCDLVVRQNLSAIYSMDMQGHWVAAVQEFIWKGSLKRLHTNVSALGLQAEDYFNSGVLLLDLDRMRNLECSQRMLEYARNPSTLKRLADQEAFNAVASGRWLHLPLKWNVTVPAFLDREFDIHLGPVELNEARHSPGIVHLCSADKPWLRDCRHPYRSEYIRHRDATPWADAEAEYRKMDVWTRLSIPLPLAVRTAVYRALRASSLLPPKRKV